MKRVLKLIILLVFFISFCWGFTLTAKKKIPEVAQKEIDERIFGLFQSRTAQVTEFYTYGKSLNVNAKITNIEKDNFESVRLVISDGKSYQKMYKMNTEFKENELCFYSDIEINNTIILDDLNDGDYYVFLRIKLNNNVEPKYYSLENISECDDIEYYTVTKEKLNRKVEVDFKKKTYNEKQYPYMKVSIKEETLPTDVYDIVIDAGHGGTDIGVKSGENTEEAITLEYAKLLKENLEKNGYKVKLTRDDQNTKLYNDTNMYDITGRIPTACKTKAKLMISLHVNNGEKNLKGFEIYAPCKSDLKFANDLAKKIKEYSTITFSNNASFRKDDGVYMKNFTENVIKEFENTAYKKGYEPYPITIDTPYLYTIREVGGIATNAYVDGRNESYSKNMYYNSNFGIECYQLELGYIKNDLEIIKNEKEAYIKAIVEAILNWN